MQEMQEQLRKQAEVVNTIPSARLGTCFHLPETCSVRLMVHAVCIAGRWRGQRSRSVEIWITFCSASKGLWRKRAADIFHPQVVSLVGTVVGVVISDSIASKDDGLGTVSFTCATSACDQRASSECSYWHPFAISHSHPVDHLHSAQSPERSS